MALTTTSGIALIGQILAQAEQFIAGQPITVNIPTETIDIGGIKVELTDTLVIKKG